VFGSIQKFRANPAPTAGVVALRKIGDPPTSSAGAGRGVTLLAAPLVSGWQDHQDSVRHVAGRGRRWARTAVWPSSRPR
jgi:hypothetical protein